MNTLSKILKERRMELGLKVSDIAQLSRIDQALISKYEKGTRMPSEKQLVGIALAYDKEYIQIRKEWLVSKVLYLLEDEEYASEVLILAEDRIEYLHRDASLIQEDLSTDLQDSLKKATSLKQQWSSNKPLNSLQLAKMKDYFKIQYTYDSNKIEGNTLTLQETMLVISEGLTISGKSMNEHLEAINHAEAVDYIVELIYGDKDLNKRSLLELHSLILKSIDKKNAGRYRDVPVRITGSEHVPPQPFEIGKLMENLFLYYEKNKRSVHPVILASEMHERLVSIHPFIDGNGRTARLIMNFILIKNGYTITSLKGDAMSKIAYYDALEECRNEDKKEMFHKLIVEYAIKSLSDHLDMV